MSDRQLYFDNVADIVEEYRPLFVLTDKWISAQAEKNLEDSISELSSQIKINIKILSVLDFSADMQTIQQLKTGQILPLFDHSDQLSLYRKLDKADHVIGFVVKDKDKSRKSSWLVVAFYVLVAIVLFMLILPFSRQLIKLKSAAVSLGNGDFSSRIKLPANSSLSPIVSAFNLMADQIERLLLAQKDLSNSVSHELRTPLARLKFGFEEISDVISDSSVINSLNAMQEDVRELEDLVDELLKYAEISELRDFKLENISIKKLTQKLMRGFNDSQIDIIIDVVSPLLPEHKLWCNPHHVVRALSNVLRNALRYASSVCKIEFGYEDQTIVVKINDDGPGLSVTDQERIFEPFYRAKSAQGHKGYGLGLAIAYNITSKHGGKLTVCKGDYSGACFQFQFPNQTIF